MIGQGICGTFMYRYLADAGYTVLVIDEARNNSASKVAAGVINPVTGRRIVKTWLIDEVMPFALQEYKKLGNEFNISAVQEMSIVEFLPTPQIRESFLKKISEDSQYIAVPEDSTRWQEFFNYDFGFGEISPALLVNLPLILDTYRDNMRRCNNLLEEKFEIENLIITGDHLTYKDIKSTALIFCDGISSGGNRFFRDLPFAPNKGEAVLVEVNDLPANHIYKKGFTLVPWKNNIFWLGANYLWEFDTDIPTPGFYRFAENWLKQTLKLPFKIVDHLAGIRPATLERRPFVGFHPVYKNIGLFNGMGTKGCSLAPFFARQFVEFIKYGTAVYKEADIKRFSGILSRLK